MKVTLYPARILAPLFRMVGLLIVFVCAANVTGYGQCNVTGPATACVGQSVEFETDCPLLDQSSWHVNGSLMGGGTSNFSHTFQFPGTHTVEFASSGEECRYEYDPDSQSNVLVCEPVYTGSSMTIEIVLPISTPVLQSDKTVLCSPSPVILTVTNPQSGIAYSWSSVPSGYSGSGSQITFSNVNQTTEFVVTASNSNCSLSSSKTITYEQTLATPVLVSASSYRKSIVQPSVIQANHYWQTSSSGTDNMYPANGSLATNNPATYHIRKYSAAGGCWSVATGPLTVPINYTPPLLSLSLGFKSGYTEAHLTNVEKTHILQFADYYLVSSLNGTETNNSFTDKHKFRTAGTYYLRGRDRGTGAWGPTLQFTIFLASDNLLNWVQTKSFDGGPANNVTVSESKSYFNDAGKHLQSQTKNLEENIVFATQDLRDRYDRVAGQTLPAPINKSDFEYFEAFNQNSSGEKYGYGDFDGGTTKYNPNPVANTAKGTLGWYYSSNNTDEPLVGKTLYPYSRTEFYKDGTGEVKRSASPGDQHRLGSGHETLSGTFPVFGELNDYLAKRRLTGLTDQQTDNTLKHEGVQSVVRDANGKYAISITDKTGQQVMSARKGTSSDYTLKVTNSVSASSDPNSPNYRQNIYFYILEDQHVTFNFSAPNQTTPSGTVYGSTIERTAYNSAEKELVAGQQIILRPNFNMNAVGTGNTFKARISSGDVGVATGMFTIENLLTGQLFTPGSGHWPAGFYKINLLSGSFDLSFTNYYTDVSYQFYNDASRLVSSVSPNGYKSLVSGTAYSAIDKTTYEYNHQGWLLAVNEPDAGRTEYVYRKDGKIRFSQNAQQRTDNRFSYTHYDKLGRPVESGEYTGAAIAFKSAAMASLIETPYDQITWTTERKDWVKTYYDLPSPELSATNLPASPYTQDFVTGAVSWTENSNMRTWYSYDELGRVTWVVQKPTTANLPRVFAIQYQYDFLGNVLKVSNLAYNTSGQLSEQFHHHYTYDKDKRLVAAYTSLDGAKRKLRASYAYYQHGPLKRVELNNTMQGVDYVYNVNGWLTNINHPNTTRDPGNDGANGFLKDVFGMQLDYYQSDMPGLFSGTATPMYNGLIAAAQWRTDEAYATNANDLQGIYTYTYDDKYQIKEANWANPNATWNGFTSAGNRFRLTGMVYDPNGNIKSLNRYDNNSALKHDFTYAYSANNNKLTSVSGYVGAYSYNLVGQLTGEDKVSGDNQYIDYDVSGKVRVVYSGSQKTQEQRKVEYLYDDHGFRMAKINYTTNLTTWYIRDASGNVVNIYESSNTGASLAQTEVPLYGAGKLGTYYPQETGAIAFELTDHLGNVRAVVKKQTTEYLATMEDNGQSAITNPRVQEMQAFDNLFETEKDDANFNHTPLPGSTRSSYLNWISGTTTEHKSVGPAIALKVEKNDTLKLETWARYRVKTSYSRNATIAMVSSLLGGDFSNAVGFEGVSPSTVASEFNGAITGSGLFNDSDNSRPYAYLNYVMFDDNMDPIGQDWVRVPLTAGFNAGEEGLPNKHVKVEFPTPIIPDQKGYIYIWVSNLGENTDVWFDDTKITHTQTIVAQATDYGVWGDVLREQKATSYEQYRFGYQGQFAERDLETGWNHFELREYDPVIGRWTSKDPAGQYWSPYLGMGNNPVSVVDPDGAYSRFGAWWRSGFSNDIYQDGGEWGYNTSSIDDGVIAVTPHFGDEMKPFTIDFSQNEVLNGLHEKQWMTDFNYRAKFGGEKIDAVNIEFEAALLVTTWGIGNAAIKRGANVVEQVAVHGNSLKSLRPTWGYKLYSTDGTFLKNGITSAVKAESRYTKAFMSDKVMLEKTLFPNRAAAYQWEFQQNQILRGPLNLNMH